MSRLRIHHAASRVRPFLLSLMLMLGGEAVCATVRYPKPPPNDDNARQYHLRLLTLALQKAGAGDTLQAASLWMPQARLLAQLQAGRDIDVVWTVTSREREKQLLPIRIPITKGLNGWRFALVSEQKPDLLRDVRRAADLAALRAGQGHDWPDTAILRANRLEVEAVSHYPGLFKMLKLGRIDYFPRAASEVFWEIKDHGHEGIMLDPHIAIYYPGAMYFFVHRDNVALAQRIEKGLNLAIADGSFERLFQQQYGETLKRLEIPKRRIIELENPDFPAEAAPMHRPELWFRPATRTDRTQLKPR
ncbi:ABC transporter substrate-binding protein [Chitinimonas sp. BJYL2]|uniref:substrate-binding periplasmic protein n=1 Tax=Chitinimonas sp. BJYL2 TaxID=2976696 RepID=UPI0022B35DC5|nr:transporter substrate-binding domain-containing protein [Chitinimonas sp. BJYL2]